MGGLNRNHLKRTLRGVRRFKTWQLIIILVLLGFLFATFLRLDNIHYLELRTAVTQADEEGSNDEIFTSITELKQFVFTHTVVNMVEANGAETVTFGTGPFYLEYQYERAARAALEKAETELSSAGDGVYGGLYDEVAAYCANLGRQYGWRTWSKAYIECMLNGLAAYPEAGPIQDLQTAMIPPTSLYFHNYASPLWAPTWAGWTFLLLAIIVLILAVRFLVAFFLRILLLFTKHKSNPDKTP
jgi:hypothetical protein